MAAGLLLANDAGEQFPKLFYQTVDNNRQVSSLIPKALIETTN